MILDSSALLAIYLREDDWQVYFDKLANSPETSISVVSYVESGIIADNRISVRGGLDLNVLLDRFGVAIEPVTAAQGRIARRAYLAYGKGNHAARLNLGDCFSYALSKEAGRPLLFKGDDFAKTDVVSAI